MTGGEVRAGASMCATQGHLWGPAGTCTVCGEVPWRMEDQHERMIREANAEVEREMPWRETVRDIYDALHFAPGNVFDDDGAGQLAAYLIALIEKRHPDYFLPFAKADAAL